MSPKCFFMDCSSQVSGSLSTKQTEMPLILVADLEAERNGAPLKLLNSQGGES